MTKIKRVEKRGGNKKKANIFSPSHEALNEKTNMVKDLGEGRKVVVLLKGLYFRNEVSEEAGFPQGVAQHEPISYHFPLPDVICFEFTNAERTPLT